MQMPHLNFKIIKKEKLFTTEMQIFAKALAQHNWPTVPLVVKPLGMLLILLMYFNSVQQNTEACTSF